MAANCARGAARSTARRTVVARALPVQARAAFSPAARASGAAPLRSGARAGAGLGIVATVAACAVLASPSHEVEAEAGQRDEGVAAFARRIAAIDSTRAVFDAVASVTVGGEKFMTQQGMWRVGRGG